MAGNLVLFVQETWLHENSNYQLYNNDGYKLFKKHAEPDCSNHGGLINYIKDNIKVSKTEIVQQKITYECLISYLKIENNKTIKIINTYRPPQNANRTFDNFIHDFIPNIANYAQDASEVIIAGDFNINFLSLNENRQTSLFFDHMLNLQFFPKITFPTHFLERSCTLIDNVVAKLSPYHAIRYRWYTIW